MSKRIYKYTLQNLFSQFIRMPIGANIIKVGEQLGTLTVWAEIDDAVKETERVYFEIYGTGHELSDEPKKHLGTVITEGAPSFVWHVYLRGEPNG